MAQINPLTVLRIVRDAFANKFADHKAATVADEELASALKGTWIVWSVRKVGIIQFESHSPISF
jgi:hypothetical protein